MTLTQMRDYLVRPDRIDDYVEVWRERIHPLRLAHGFQIDGAWLARDEGRFFWTLSYDRAEDWVAANDRYDAERRRFEPDPATWLLKEQKITVEPVLPDRFGIRPAGRTSDHGR